MAPTDTFSDTQAASAFRNPPPGEATPWSPPAAQPDSGGNGKKWWVLVAMVFGLFMPMLDNLVVNVALPTIQRSLGAGFSSLAWIIDAYTLTFASFMLTGGSMGDLFGRKKFFMGGLVLFTLGSLACGLSANTGQLIAFRAIQGLGAALLLPGSLSIITATFHGKERGSAIGIWAAMSGLAVAIGPLIGGYLVEHVSWQAIFFVNIPVGIIGFILTAIVVKDSRDLTKSRRIDPPGLITGTAAVFFLVYALIEGNSRGWRDSWITGSFGLALLFFVIFLVVESKRSSPMLPLKFFRNPTFAASNVVAASVFFALFGTVFFLALYLQNIRGFSPFATGVRLMPFTAAILLISPISGKLSDRHGSRWLMTLGTAVAAVGLGLLLRTQPQSSYFTVIFPAFVVLGSGMALTMAPMTAAVMGSVEPRHAGVASAATNTSRELGGVFGIALLGAIVTSAFKHRFLTNLLAGGIPRPAANAIIAKASSGAAAGGGSLKAFRDQAPPGTPAKMIEQVAGAAQHSFVHAIHVGMVFAIAFMVFASIVALVFVRSHVRHDNPPPEAEQPVMPAAEANPHPDLSTTEIGLAPLNAGSAEPQNGHAARSADESVGAVFAGLPFKAGAGSVQRHLEEAAQAALVFYQEAASRPGALSIPALDTKAISGYLLLEQRFGRISRRTSPEQAASLLVGAVSARAFGLGDYLAVSATDHEEARQFVKSAVRIVLEGISSNDTAPQESNGKPAGREV